MITALLIATAAATFGQTSTLTPVGAFNTGLWTPGRLASAPGGEVYVTDQLAAQVVRYAADSSVTGTFPIPQGPVGIAVAADGRVLVSRQDGAVGIYDASFNLLGTLNPAPLTLTQPNDMAVHPTTGEVFVVDSAQHQILVFDGTTGALARAWGIEGSGLGSFESPQAIAIDPALNTVLVADADNFRVQVFDTTGILQFKFGYHTLYLATSEVAWFPRSEGIAVDSCSNIYVADALMGTVRVFSRSGRELSASFTPLLAFGTGSGQLRVPCDVLINGGKLYVASTSNSSVEVFDLTCSQQGQQAAPLAASSGDEGPVAAPAPASDSIENPHELAAPPYDYPLQPPHMLNYPNTCARCHDMDGLPAGGMLTAAGQENLCISCHTASGHAMDAVILPGEANLSHPWGVAASQLPQVPGPAPTSELALHLDNGNIRCGTCHDQHESPYAGEQRAANASILATHPWAVTTETAKYLRGSTIDGQLCGECHSETAEWQHAGHSDVNADPWSHYDWALSSRSACRKCHSGYGYIDNANGLAAAQQRGSFRTLDCLVCHSTHGKSQGDQLLRVYDTVTLPKDGPDLVLTTEKGNATCMTCHNGRVSPDSRGTGLTPHYLLGAVTLQGINGIAFGNTLQNSPHKTLASCTDCHMAPSPAAGQPGAGKVGGHSFNMKVTHAGDPDLGFENVQNACNTAACHGGTEPLEDFNRTAFGDYDGDGTIEGVEDETQGLLDLVLAQIQAKGAVQLPGHPYWNVSGVQDVPPGNLQLVKDAIWNWQLVTNSADNGIHNTAYVVGLLQVTYKALTGADVPGAFLRYATPVASLSKTNVVITSVNGGAPVQPGQATFAVNFTVKDDAGADIAKSDLTRIRIYVSGPTTNYNRVITSEQNLANLVQNPDGSYTYTRTTAFPTVYSAPVNDSADLGAADGELTGQPLQDGTYTVLIETRRTLSGVTKSGDATFDFVIDADGVSPPAILSRQVVTRDACNKCHNDLTLHGGGRMAVTGCVLCHTAGSEDYITNPASTPGLTVSFQDMIHRLHRGSSLPRVAATGNSADPYRYVVRGHNGSPADFSDIGFPIIPSGIMDCTACHEGAANGGNAYTTITRAKCSTCHDDIDFTTGTILDTANPSVSGGLLTQADLSNPAYRVAPGGITHAFVDDSACSACHGPGGFADIQPLHQHITDPAREGTQPAVEILSITGMTGGGGAFFQAGDAPRITFRLRDNTADPLVLVSGNKAIADSITYVIFGPTTLYQNIVPAKSIWSNGALATGVSGWTVNPDSSYSFTAAALPANFPAQLNSIGQTPASQIYPFEGGWGQLYTAAGTPLSAGTYTVAMYGRRLTPTGGQREPIATDTFDVPVGAAGPVVPYAGTVTTESCNACHGALAFHGNQREGVESCLACHTAGSQNRVTGQSIDLRIMVHKLHNARNLTGQPYELNTNGGLADFSHLMISAMPGEAAECHVCHTTDAWKNPPVRDNMRTWMVACTSCHDSPETAAHVNSATAAGTFVESCTSCHGDGSPWSVERMH